ncbi:MAG: hypothetical protein QOJ19_73 [Acidimicrobiia bacterium]|nr:hypothetical protein [Acidimicrobiia bacterium]
MTTRPRQLHLGVAIDGLGHHPAAWRRAGTDPSRVSTAEPFVAHAQLAERGMLDFVTLDDSFVQSDRGERTDRIPIRLDVLLTLARVAPHTSSIGLIPTIDTTHTEPFNVSKNVATVDWVSRGRAGWRPAVATTDDDYLLFGRRQPAALDELYEEAAAAVDVVARLWDSWEDDAIIRDKPTGRYVDRDKLHYVDFDSRFFSVRGPSITPRPPQGQPLVMVHADTPPATALAASAADIVSIDAADADAAGQKREDVRSRAAALGRNPDNVFVMAGIDVLLGSTDREANEDAARLEALDRWDTRPDRPRFIGTADPLTELLGSWFNEGAVDGFVLFPARLPADLHLLVDAVVPGLQRADLFRRSYADSTLRDHFGLARPSNRYAGIR